MPETTTSPKKSYELVIFSDVYGNLNTIKTFFKLNPVLPGELVHLYTVRDLK